MNLIRGVAIPALVLALCWPLQADNSFFRVLAAKPNATLEDTIKAVYMLSTGESSVENKSFEQVCDIMRQKGVVVVKDPWSKTPDRMVNRGQISYMLCKALGVRGGITMHLTGVSERYAFRECVYLNLVPAGTQWDLVTGGELVGILANAAEYQEKHRK